MASIPELIHASGIRLQISTCKITSPAPRESWQELFKSDTEAIPYQHAAWLDCMCKTGKYEDVSRLYETSNNRQFLLPLVRRKGFPQALTPAASLPSGWGMGGLIGTVQADDVAAVFNDLARLPFPQITIRPNPRHGEVWAAGAPRNVISIPRRAHVLTLEGGFDEVWSKRFEKKTRTAVRKAERLGVVVECDTTGRLIPVFYDLLRRSLDRWSQQQHEPRLLTHLRGYQRDPLHKFETIAKNLGDACRVWVAWVNGQPAASILVLQYGNVNDSRGAMDKEVAATTGANELIQKLAIEEACRADCRYYHLGESGNSASLAHYKERFGAVAYPYAEYRLERLPLTRIDGALRGLVKRAIGFKDV
jgi:CelD/BcsL family acetyltransferase involved in cellulose biosynthesis